VALPSGTHPDRHCSSGHIIIRFVIETLLQR
jgi:hypothetical protein